MQNAPRSLPPVGPGPQGPRQGAGVLVRSDSIIIVHIPANHDAAYLVSLPRDTWVDIPAFDNGEHRYPGGHNKINAAFAFGGSGLAGLRGRVGGFNLLQKTIRQDYGITFDAGAIVDFAGFQQVVNVLGGVTMNVDEKTTSIHIGHDSNGKTAAPFHINSDGTVGHRIKGVTPMVYSPGVQHLKAWQALDYVRQRDLLANGDLDYGRQRHQQQFLKAVFKEMLSAGTLSHPDKLAAVAKTVGKAMTLDTRNIPIADWVFAMKGIGGNDILTIKTNDGKLNPQVINGLDVETLSPDSMELLRTVKQDRVAEFVAIHPDWVAD